ncbi:MAG: ABC transporter permease subunit [Streptosporangiaceae bacterium]
MNWRAVRAIVRRDLILIAGNKQVIIGMVVVPAVLLIGMPIFIGIVASTQGAPADGLDEYASFVRFLSPALRAAAPGAQIATAVLTVAFAPIILLAPLMATSMLAAASIAGERERGTLEALLLVPISDRELLAAKLAGAWVPALVVNVAGAICYAVVVDAVMWPTVHQLVLPNALWFLLTFWLGPALSAAGLGATVLVSARARTFQGASQLSAALVMPVIFLVTAQGTGLVLLGAWVGFVVGIALWLITAWLVAVAARSLTRTRLGQRLG